MLDALFLRFCLLGVEEMCLIFLVAALLLLVPVLRMFVAVCIAKCARRPISRCSTRCTVPVVVFTLLGVLGIILLSQVVTCPTDEFVPVEVNELCHNITQCVVAGVFLENASNFAVAADDQVCQAYQPGEQTALIHGQFVEEVDDYTPRLRGGSTPANIVTGLSASQSTVFIVIGSIVVVAIVVDWILTVYEITFCCCGRDTRVAMYRPDAHPEVHDHRFTVTQTVEEII